MSTIQSGITIKGPEGQTWVTGSRGRVPSWVEDSLKYKMLVAKAEHPDHEILVNKELGQVYVVGATRGRVPAWVAALTNEKPAKETPKEVEPDPVKTEAPKAEEAPKTDEQITLHGPDGATYVIGATRGRVPTWVVEHPKYQKHKGMSPAVKELIDLVGKSLQPVVEPSPTFVQQDPNVYVRSETPIDSTPTGITETEKNDGLDIDNRTLNLYASRLQDAIAGYKKAAPDYFIKKELHKTAISFLDLFAQVVLNEKVEKSENGRITNRNYDIRSNLAGDGVWGEITLHTETLYVVVNVGTEFPIMYRTCNSRNDYTGGTNTWVDSPARLVESLRKVSAGD